MKKKYFLSVLFFSVIALFIIIQLNLPKPPRDTIRGTFQSKMDQDNYFSVQLTFESDDTSFVQYHEGKQVDSGTYKNTGNNIYLLKSDLQDTYIILQEDNLFYYYNTVSSKPIINDMKLKLTAPAYIDQTNF